MTAKEAEEIAYIVGQEWPGYIINNYLYDEQGRQIYSEYNLYEGIEILDAGYIMVRKIETGEIYFQLYKLLIPLTKEAKDMIDICTGYIQIT